MLILVLLWVSLMVILAAGALWLQGYLYSEPASGLAWRGPAAGSAVALLVAFWTHLHSRAPERYDVLHRVPNPADVMEFKEFRSLSDDNDLQGTVYHLRKSERVRRVVRQYYDTAKDRPWSRSPAIIVKDEEGQEVRFNAERDENGNYKINPERNAVAYRDDRGRVMYDEPHSMGVISTFRFGVFLANILLNFGHFVLWFVCLWPLLRFQWSHALGLAVVFWALMTLLVVPMVFDATVTP